MSLLIKTDIFGAKETTDLLGEISSIATNLSALVDGDGEEQLKLALGRAAQRTINRQDYPALKKEYEKAKIKRVGRKKILERSAGPANLIGLLTFGRSFTLRADAGGKVINISLSDPLAAYHQVGAGDLPERHVIEADQELSDDTAQIYNEGLQKRLARKLKRR